MSYVMAVPELMTAAATDIATIGDTINAAHMAAAAPTGAVLPAAADEVSAGIAHLMSGYGQEYRALAGQAAAFHQQFVQRMTASAGAYASAEAGITSWLESSFLGGLVGWYLRETIAFEQGIVRGVVADPARLRNPVTYFDALSPILFPLFLPFLLPFAIPAALILSLFILSTLSNTPGSAP